MNGRLGKFLRLFPKFKKHDKGKVHTGVSYDESNLLKMGILVSCIKKFCLNITPYISQEVKYTKFLKTTPIKNVKKIILEHQLRQQAASMTFFLSFFLSKNSSIYMKLKKTQEKRIPVHIQVMKGTCMNHVSKRFIFGCTYQIFQCI